MRTLRLMALVSALALSACPKPQSAGVEMSRGPLDATSAERHSKLVAEGDQLWAERLDEQKLRAALAKWEEAVTVKPDDHETYAKLARGYYFLADGHLSFDPARQAEFLAAHEKGTAHAEKGMYAISPEFEKKRKSGIKLADAVAVLGRDAVPLMYWYATNLGKWAKAQGIAETLKHKDVIFNTITHVYELDPDYFYGAPDRYFGSYYAVAPAFAGGDLQKSKEYFDNSVKKAPDYLATYVLIADLYAPKAQDPDLYKKSLDFVLQAPVDTMPDLVPEQTIEKKKAELLLKQMDDRF